MPAASHSPSGTTSQGSILLIEEYDALAAAITSALKKFAPAHQVHVARNLTEAKAAAKSLKPELFVIDFDPAFPGLTPFLQKIQKTHGDACALIIAGKLPAKLAGSTRSAGALQFVEKPFDVHDFGAAVQALLGPWRESETATTRSTLEDLSLAELLIAQCAGARTIAVEVSNENGKSGEILLNHGTPTHAEVGRKSGEDALREMLGWRTIEVREGERPRSTRRTIEEHWPDVIIESVRPPKPKKRTAPPKAAPAKAAVQPAKKLVLVDDTEMLLIFVEDVLTTSGANFQITTAPTGLSGIEEIGRIQPDLVLLDYSLPDINGGEVCRRLLQNSATARIPVLMMSGHVVEMAQAGATLENIVATIEKPFRGESLVSLVQQVLTEGRRVPKKVPPARKAALVVTAPAPAPPSKLPAPTATPRAEHRPPEPAVEQPAATPSAPASAPAERDPPAATVSQPPAEPVQPPPAEPTTLPEQHPAPTVEPVPATESLISAPQTSGMLKESIPAPPVEKTPPAAPKASPPPSTPPPPSAKPEQRIPPSESVVDKARRAIGNLRRQIAPKEENWEEKPAVPSPPAGPVEQPASETAAIPPAAPAAEVLVPKLEKPPEGPVLQPKSAEPEVMATRVVSEGPNEVVLSLFLEVVSVQLTPELRMGSIRARPSSGEVSLHVLSPGALSNLPRTGFKLGPVGLDDRGRIRTVRLVPTQQPVKDATTQHSLQIGAVSVVPIDSTSRMQLTPAAGAPMTLQLLANLELAGVELSSTFQIAQIVLRDRGQPIRVTMNSHEQNGTACETVDVRLDRFAQIKELMLDPIR
ncbi:MAG: response regulator [Chthoniobacterales bacterium]